jgi:hypothetical protein
MKYFVLLILVIVFLSLTDYYASGYLDKTTYSIDPDPLALWNEHDLVVDGTITFSMPHRTHPVTLQYDIKVNEIFKPADKSIKTINAITNNSSTYFEPGSRALFYLDKIEDTHKVSIYSVLVKGNCDARDLIQISPILPNDDSFVRGAPILPWDWKDPCVPSYFTYDPDFWNYMEYKPPLRQYKDHNLPISAQRCGSDEHVPIISEFHPHNIVCVKPETKQKLIERGWTRTNYMHQNIILTNNFPNIKDRDIRVIVDQTENQDNSLSVRVLEKTARIESSESIMFQKIGHTSTRTMTKNDEFFIISSPQSNSHLLENYPTEPTLQTLYVGNTKEQISIYFPVEIPLDASAKDKLIIFNYSLPYMLPDFDNTYSFKLASFSPVKIELPSSAKIIDREVSVHNGFWLFDKSDDDQLSYKTEEYSLFYGYDEPSIPVKSVVVYNIKFEL